MLTKCLSIHNKVPVTKWSVCVLLMGISALIFSRPVDAHLAPIASIAGQSFGEVISDEHSLGRSDPEDAIPATELGKRRHASAKEEGRPGLKGELRQALGVLNQLQLLCGQANMFLLLRLKGRKALCCSLGNRLPPFS